MTFKLFGLALVGVILYISAPTQAGVLRSTEKSIDTVLPETQTSASDLPESTTIQIVLEENDAHSRDEDATIKIGTASLDPAPGTLEAIEITLETIEDKTEDTKKNEKEDAEQQKTINEKDGANKDDSDVNKNESALSRDEAASIKINVHESDDLAKGIPASSVEMIHDSQKSSKLLLLSTPRLAREQEENIEEAEDVDIDTEVSTDETTEVSTEAHTEIPKTSEEKDDKPSFITKVRDAIFGKKSVEEMPKPSEQKNDEEAKINDVEKKEEKQGGEEDKEGTDNTDSTLPAAAEQMPVPHNDNAASTVLIETEPDYVIFDSDVEHVEHLGSFTHADSDEHLQPIVHSVEVVPSHFEEPLLFTSSYVHAW